MMCFCNKLLVTKCLKIQFKTDYFPKWLVMCMWLILWVRCIFYAWIIHKSVLSDKNWKWSHPMTGLDNAYSLYTHCRPIHVRVATGLTWDFSSCCCVAASGHWLSRWCRRINALFHLQAFIVTVTSVSWGRIVWKTRHTLHFRQMSVFRSWKDILCENKKTSQEQKINFFLL